MSQEAKVLVVDDKEANRYSIDRILNPLGIPTYHARSGAEALQEVLQHDFALILLDVVMPELDGYETARLIHGSKRFQHVPIVMITAHDNTKEQYLQAYEAGAMDYICKPVEPIVLINKVKQFIELHQQRLAAQLSQSKEELVSTRMQALLNSAGEGILGVDQSGNISFANPKACELLKIDHVDLLRKCLQDFFYLESDQSSGKETFNISHGRSDIIGLFNQVKDADTHKERWVTALGDAFYVEFSYEIIKDSTGTCSGGVVMFQNVSDRKTIEEKLIRLAHFDPLTKLANRAYFHDALPRAMSRSLRSKNTLALFFIDLDNFKNINDSLGHDAGDVLLQTVGERIVDCIRSGDLTARMGGDEFAIILHDLHSITDVVKVAEKIIGSIHKPIGLLGNNVITSASIGIAVYEDGSMTPDNLMKAADTAMYVAKNGGRNNYQFFNLQMQKKVEEKNRIRTALQQAIENNELSIHYQPKVSITTNDVVGLEALLRWTTSEGVIISPATFIPIAEDSGQVNELGAWVFRQVCQQIKRWSSLASFSNLIVSVNVSACQLKSGDFHLFVKAALDEYGINASNLELELTETAVMDDPVLAVKELQAIHDLGVSISIDDFGTGYSSLSYLKRFPVDVLKIDRCFVKDIGKDQCGEGIIKIIVAIAHTMGIHVIAEGIETKQQLAFLASIGCDHGQGYFFSKAKDKKSTMQMIKNMDACFKSRFDEMREYMLEHNIEYADKAKISI